MEIKGNKKMSVIMLYTRTLQFPFCKFKVGYNKFLLHKYMYKLIISDHHIIFSLTYVIIAKVMLVLLFYILQTMPQ